MFYIIEGIEYEIYESASKDFCVTVSEYGKMPLHYNLGTKENALNFILSRYEVDGDDE